MEDGVTDQELKEQIQENVEESSSSKRVDEDQESGGGLINHLISIMSPRARDAEKNGFFYVKNVDESEDVGSKVEDQSGNIGSESGGLINNFISNIFHPNESVVENHQEEKSDKNEEANGGSVIENIVSHLPTPLGDEAVPATDEASILIHSIVHD